MAFSPPDPAGGEAAEGEAGWRWPRPPLCKIRPERRRPDGRPANGSLALPSARSGWRGGGEMGGQWPGGSGDVVDVVDLF